MLLGYLWMFDLHHGIFEALWAEASRSAHLIRTGAEIELYPTLRLASLINREHKIFVYQKIMNIVCGRFRLMHCPGRASTRVRQVSIGLCLGLSYNTSLLPREQTYAI